LQPTDGDKATPEDVLHSDVSHGAGTRAAHSIDVAAAHHMPLLVAPEAAKHGAKGFKHRRTHTIDLARCNLHTRIDTRICEISSNDYTLIRLREISSKRAALLENPKSLIVKRLVPFSLIQIRLKLSSTCLRTCSKSYSISRLPL
jgi:hypothetical protein